MSDPVGEKELEQLFQEALGLAPERRPAFLLARCGTNRVLFERVQALLAEDAQGTRGLLRAPAADAPRADEERIGRYRLVRVLGEGGMGTVHLAEQEEPVRRLVALKTIRLGSFSRGAAAGFAAECQALADMNHPGIAKIFDGGVTEAGLPYFVMEYAPGLALTEHCDRFQLSLEERLELLAKVCDAVQHAHHKGIVHRDLKPGNVLVDVREGQPQPRVIDFGIARALAGQLAPGAAAPPLTDRLGTPAYMSPARLRGDSGVDTRDDVYSLGVLLYQLLTARYPYEQGTRAELARALERAPLAPSARIEALGPDLQEVARERATTPRHLLRTVHGELDALALRALAPDPLQRYDSAAALAEDLRRFLRHEALLGVPAGTLRSAAKFLRRHWIGAGFAAVLATTLVVALVLQRAAWSTAEERRRAAESARIEAEAARGEALRSQAFEHGEREEADLLVRAFNEALLLGQAGESTGKGITVAELLDVLAGNVDVLGRTSPGAESSLRAALGRSYLAIGADSKALEQFLRANAVGGTTLAEDALDRFDVLQGLIESMRRTGDTLGARKYVAQAIAVARSVFAGREGRFIEALETLLDVAAGATAPEATGQDEADQAALAALEVVLAALPDAIVRGDESGVTARILVEAAVQLVRRNSPRAPEFLAALERRASELLAPEDIRLVTFQWSLMHARLQPTAQVGEETVRAGRELVRAAEERLPRGHWVRSDAHRLLGQALSRRSEPEDSAHDGTALEEAEAELLSALAEARLAPSASRRRLELARDALGALAQTLGEIGEKDPARLARFLEHSYGLHGADPAARTPWWLALQPRLPAGVLEATDAFLRARAGPAANLQRAILLARPGHFDAALRAFETAPAGPPIAQALRALSLANLGRLPEAQAELVALAERRRADPEGDPELDDLLVELRDLLGL